MAEADQDRGFVVWERAKRDLRDGMVGLWGELLAELSLVSIQRGPRGPHYVFGHPDQRGAALTRLERRICEALALIGGEPGATMEIMIRAQEAREEEQQAGDEEPDEEPKEAPESYGSGDLERAMRHAARMAGSNKLERWGVRNKVFRYYPIGTYEALFWRAYLGSGPYALWDALRAHAEAGLPWPSQRDLAEIAVGSRNSHATAAKYLDTLRNEGIVLWHDSEDGLEYYIRKELPLLTPHQAERLSDQLQTEHRDWLRRAKILKAWTHLQAKTLVPPMTSEDEKVIAFQRSRSA